MPQGMKGHHKFKWDPVEMFGDPGPKPIPQPPSPKQMGLSHPGSSEVSLSCSTWSKPVAVSGNTSLSMSGYGRNGALGNHDADGFNSQDAFNVPLG